MDLENSSIDLCFICKHFVIADRETIRHAVFHHSRQLGEKNSRSVKEDLCAKHLHIGFSARSQTVGRPVKSDAPEAEEIISPLLPTFLNTISGKLLTPTRYRYSWLLHYRRFLRRSEK